MTVKIIRSKRAFQKRTGGRRKELEGRVARCALAASAANDLFPDMALELLPIDSLKAARRRARKTDPAQLERVMRSIRTLLQSVPILIDGDRHIINGHIVVEALKSLGMDDVWCVIVDHLSEDEQDLLHVALNRIAECGDWDFEELGPLLIELDDIGFDLETTGFSLPELDILMVPSEIAESEEEEELPEPPADPLSRLGDLWLLGDHKLLCGDATKDKSYILVLGDEPADAVFTDCPWNIPIEGFVSGLGKKKHKDFKMGAGEMSAEEFAGFTDRFSQLCADHLVPGGAFFSCIDWRNVEQVVASGRKAGLKLINMAVWNKGSGGMGTYLRSAHELIPVFCNGDKLAVNNVELGRHGRYRSNVWSYPGANRRGSSANDALAHHPTPKPVEMVRDALLDVTKRGGRVLDPFLGSGTTLLAAEQCGRRAACIELDPAYVDVVIMRWEAMTGRQAVHAETELTCRALVAQRAADENAD